ncbi:Lorelei-like-gpi-anchored protein 1 [Dorcoceras hygrometricum]|uniref:Lorelei-like-gpi-anchored protein 1 n=1 Tax=Dorcoceras hygrometricum TaxID=472368 RepID=A0A2Z7BVJ0_9LAMI|nr:Lorelei-like-gpi-anchored protein 1 [Dorcoceras hygrometricum]
MGSCQLNCLVLVLCFSLFTAISASTFISDGIFGSQILSERRLLQAKKPCPVNFEFQNYTIITSKCKGPEYAPNLCCSAFKDFACPFAEDLNDLSNDCASTMFSYINLYGKYPPGLFASECREGKLGLGCPAVSPSVALSDKSANANGSGRMSDLLPMLILLVASLLLSMQLI